MSKKHFAGISLAFTPALLTLAIAAQAQAKTSTPSTDASLGADILVTANRLEMPASRTGSSVTVIPASVIERSQKTTVVELLRTLPGLSVSQSGTGGTASVFIRGANSGHTKVLIDGIDANDPVDGNRAYNFAHLSLTNIERIEILRGPQSTLYGSDAMGGVINIITKKGQRTTEGGLGIEAGSFGTFNQNAHLSGGNDRANYALAVGHTRTDSISAAASKAGNREKDGNENTTLSGRAGFIINDQLDIELLGRTQHAVYDLDDYDNLSFQFMDDHNHVADDKQQLLRLAANLALFEDRWTQTLGVSLTKNDRIDQDNGSDPAQPADTFFRDEFHGRTLKGDWQHRLQLSDSNTLIGGLESATEEAFTINQYGNLPKHRITTQSLYLQDSFQLIELIDGTLGARHDDNEDFGSQTTYRATLSYQALAGTRLFTTYGTGFKAPSIFQLYAPGYGNKALQAETSNGFDAGVEQQLTDSLALKLTYFQNDFDDLISYDYVASKFINVAAAKTSGAEFELTAQPGENVQISASYTYTDTEDKSNGKRLLRRPLHKAATDIAYQLNPQTEIAIGANYTGTRDDIGFPTNVELDDYVLIDLRLNHQASKAVKLFGRIENLFDEDYEEVRGYGTRGLGAYAGVSLDF